MPTAVRLLGDRNCWWVYIPVFWIFSGVQVVGKEPVSLTGVTSVGGVRPRSSTCSTCSISSAREGVLALVWQPEIKAKSARQGRVIRITTRNAPRAPIAQPLCSRPHGPSLLYRVKLNPAAHSRGCPKPHKRFGSYLVIGRRQRESPLIWPRS